MTVPVPLLALVGRPNVGKSTLFNRLVGRRTALVDDQPGVTRDRIFGETTMDGKRLRVVDTGGLDVDPDDVLLSGMRAQTQLAVDEADLVLLVVDGAEGITPADHDIVRMLRRGGTPTVIVVNKVDIPGHEVRVHEAYELGVEQVVAVSAEHGRGLYELEEAVFAHIQAPPVDAVDDPSHAPIHVTADDDEEAYASRVEWSGGPIRVAVIGRPNAGKSSLVNRLIGDDRLLATDVPGTTRDPIDTHVEVAGQAFVFIDTAGVRRKRSIGTRLEQFAVVKAFQSIDRADVVLMVLDATERPSDQDARIAGMADDKGKGLVLVTNKWDLVENPEWRERYPDAVRHKLPFATYAPMLRVSAKTGRSTQKVFDAIVEAQKERHRRVGTAELNRFFREKVADNPPPTRGGKRARLYYVSQPLVRPPTFIFSSSRSNTIHFSYRRYLENALRERYGFDGTPIWLKFRDRVGKPKPPPKERALHSR